MLVHQRVHSIPTSTLFLPGSIQYQLLQWSNGEWFPSSEGMSDNVGMSRGMLLKSLLYVSGDEIYIYY